MIEHAVDLELRQDNPAVKARKVIAATRVTHYHRISWVELPELLTVIDQFERQRLAERSSLIALRLMMLTLVLQPSASFASTSVTRHSPPLLQTAEGAEAPEQAEP